MAWRDEADRSDVGVDFFISYSPADEQWATWVAWELERAGYSTMLQAWDFVPGTNFIDFMDRGVSRSAAVIAILSRNYIRSTYGRLEWQAAMRSSPADPGSRLITVRIEDFPLEGLLATITFVDLVPVADAETARSLLIDRIRHAMVGRAKPIAEPGYPHPAPAQAGFVPPAPLGSPRTSGPRSRAPRRALDQPVHLLQIAGPRFDRDPTAVPPQIHAKRIFTEIETRLAPAHVPGPDMLLIAGDLTRHGSLREFDVALEFVVGLRTALGLAADRVVVVPGAGDVNAAACRAYFADCEADEVEPEPPYWPKWRHYLSFLRELTGEAQLTRFRQGRPWDLVRVPELRLVVAAINTTMSQSHREQDFYGSTGTEQAYWFAKALADGPDDGWYKVGLLHHDPAELREEPRIREVLLHPLDLVVSDRDTAAESIGRLLTLAPGAEVQIRKLE
ncbi:TIR domain-containing protein [Actinoplanes philippinensis]|uniref:TIR domain-containing protein n=1 Tax=Actinoplanes philippinensis TaxID=35752 RepID=UPI0033DA56F3